MINSEEYSNLKKELMKIDNITIGWGVRRQNNNDDDKVDLFSIKSFEELLIKISSDKINLNYPISP